MLTYAGSAERPCREVAADLITLLVPAEAEPTEPAPRAVDRRTLAINTVARPAADWMDAARFVLLGFLYEGRGTSSSAVPRARQIPNIAVGLYD